MNNKELVILAGKKQGGGSVTPASIVTATGQMTAQQASDTLDNIGGEPEKLIVTVTESGGVCSADKTFAEITAAHTEGKTVVATIGGEAEFVAVQIDSGAAAFSACASYENGPNNYGWYIQSIIIYNDGQDDVCQFVMQGSPRKEFYNQNSASITPEDNTIYTCTAAALTSLTITDPPATGSYVIKFTSGSTPTTTNFPASMVFPEAFSAEASTRYEINVEDGYAVAVGWPVS